MIKEKLKAILKNKITIAILAIMLPFLIEILIFGKIEINKVALLRIGLIYGIYILIGIYKLLKKYDKQLNKIAEFIIKYRYRIAGIVLVATVLLRVNLSSISMWSSYVNEPDSKNTILGVAKGIRSDEWLTQSALMLGTMQGPDAYKIYNENIGQGNLNTLMMITPVIDIVSIGKPLMWGFILFGEEFGFSFYWMLKIILLVLVSIEFAMKITKKDNLLTLTGGIVLALAPAIMWWLSSAIADGYIFGMATIVLFSYYMNNLEWNIKRKIGLAVGLLISITSFAFVLYPAFQVPFAFFMLVVMLNDFIPNVKKLTKTDIIIMAITILGIAGIMARYILVCWNDIVIMMSTVYPGNRVSVGGDFKIDRFISYFANIFFPYSKSIANPCEESSYIYPFIALIILLIYNIKNIKEKKNEPGVKLIISLTVLYTIFLLWEFIGFGELFAKLTLMSMVPSPRLHVVVGMIGTILTLAIIKQTDAKKIFTKAQSIIISMLVVIVSYILIKHSSYAQYFNFVKIEIWSIVIFAITYFMITGNKKAWCYSMCIIAIIAGATINPICIGLSPIKNTQISKEIQEIKSSDENALWAGNSNITGQYLVANGVKTLNGVHMYPNFEWLKELDPEGKYDEVYNRFAHIHIALGKETSFSLLTPDSYLATLTYEDFKKLGIKYYYSSQKCSDEIIDEFNLESKYSNDENSQYIYLINY